MEDKPYVELLAPAGNREGFYGAIHAGADAVYLGGNRFGARAYAENFTTEELLECIRYAHLWERKVYLTVNTLVKEKEFKDVFEYLMPFYEAGLDGVIVQDTGVFAMIRDNFPGLELHVSTQMTLTSVNGAALLKDMGACRIVPARELSLQEIIHIKKETGLSIETFIHGAMCYCYSGQCLFSSILGGRSGNRGRCAQPCRLPYRVENGREIFPLSLKDMCTIEHIPELIEAGIDSFKIEGRMKKPEYAAGVTAIYRKYIDMYYQKKEWKIEQEDLKSLAGLYIRSERQSGYYYKHNGRDMVTLNNPAYGGSDEKQLAGIRRKYIETRPRLPLDIYADFVTGRAATVTIVCGEICVTAAGDIVGCAEKQPVTMENIKKQLGKLGESIFRVNSMEIHVSEDAFYPLSAVNRLRREAVGQLEDALIHRNGFDRSKALVNKASVNKISAEKVSVDKVPTDKVPTDKWKADKESEYGFVVSLRCREQLNAIVSYIGNNAESFIKRIYIDGDLLVENEEAVIEKCRYLADHMEVAIALPYIVRQPDEIYLNRIFDLAGCNSLIFSGIMVRSLDGMGAVRRRRYGGKVYADAGFYIWNRESFKEWMPYADGFCLPLELNAGEQKALTGYMAGADMTEHQRDSIKNGLKNGSREETEKKDPDPVWEKVVYGRIPMMVTANCVAKTTGQCIKNINKKDKNEKGAGERILRLTDRRRKVFPVELNCLHCMNLIYNSVPLSLHGELARWKGQVFFRLDFTVESGKETERIMEFFTSLKLSGYAKNTSKPPFGEYTTGHEKRGVE